MQIEQVYGLTGRETKEQIAAIEAAEFKEHGPDALDRFKRSRRVLYTYAFRARNAFDLEEFMRWYGLFIDYSGEIRNPSVTGNAGDDRILLAGFGIAGEFGEADDVLKKVYFHDHARKDTMNPERRDKLVLELGDGFWYAFNLMRELGIDFREVLQKNMNKLTYDPRTK
jgi:NTP pyrophosphatase (non-canonical NTP hydrolase)